ncbi:DUF6414 family protein [Leucobacter chromiireducens]|uniref:DUF6414 family protein n=1 Tax=Leucobacter chromiireducens TaxID=283877 RepID=UPI0019266294|nr:hypothetical protein [Leucobacter chromiireducens]
MFLRDYLYVDLDKVSGLASQLYDGIPEKATNVTARQKKFEADLKLVRGGSGASSEDSIERNLGDSLFKDLETDLEALGLLRDVSEDLAREDSWDAVEDIAAPGRMLRITAPGTLFQPAQMSDAIVGIATAAQGLADMGIGQDMGEQMPPLPPKAKSESQKRADRAAKQAPSEPRFPEDFLPMGETVPLMDIPRAQLSGMIRVARGVFGEGVHLHLRPAGPNGPIISARLEDGRRFLDSSPEVLISRYGLVEQEWTVVGVVGQLGSRMSTNNVDDVTNSDGSVNRAKFVDLVGNFLGETAGLVDLPRAPGFSLIPLALYRSIGESIGIE